ncbi:PREDICTED: thioredoxin domain-containing protein 12-like [Priapulus caudatus]|uniref:Thioredoxin domain-containing protein 12-like n=1 Tax=Priapulus caudatus TaxID=37621 RepID=A0ABM1E225_PRICU|nr:PREDICTED: thioredoxin domain-containing protein 12-like [Priapulus caudatus]
MARFMSSVKLFAVFLSLLTVLHVSYQDEEVNDEVEEDISNGYGNKINWVGDIDAAFEVSATENKPLMVIIHKSWCGACKSLKSKFKDSTDILELSKDFVMVNLQDEDEPDDEKFKPDGGYIPRILFFGSDGVFREDLVGPNEKYKYYVPDPLKIMDNMKKALSSQHITRSTDEL